MPNIIAIEESLMRESGDFEPLLNTPQVNADKYKICSWNRQGKTLRESIPALFDRGFVSANELEKWSIIVVSDDRKCVLQNPFAGKYVDDGLDEQNPVLDPELNELAKMLGVVPTRSVSKRIEPATKKDSASWEIKIDDQLKTKKLQQYQLDDFSRPEVIYLVAVQKLFDVDLRSFRTLSKSDAAKNQSVGVEGLYPSNCRFFKFNLSEQSNRVSNMDFLRLWMAVLSLSCNLDVDELYLKPYSLYNISSDVSKEGLSKHINSYYARLRNVRSYIAKELVKIQKERKEAKNVVHQLPNLTTSVSVNFATDENQLHLNKKQFGLATDCPVDDEAEYVEQTYQIEKRIKEYQKSPVRAVRKAVAATKDQGKYVPESDYEIYPTREQMEDIDESIEELELDLMSFSTLDVKYPKQNEKLRKAADKKVKHNLKKRSNKGAILATSGIAFLAFVLSNLPYLINAAGHADVGKVKSGEMVEGAIWLMILCVILLAVSGIISLVLFKKPLTKAFKRYDGVIDELIAHVSSQKEEYTKYLTMLSALMKKSSFRKYVNAPNRKLLANEEAMLLENDAYCQRVEAECSKLAEGFDTKLSYSGDGVQDIFVLDSNPKENGIYKFSFTSIEKGIKLNKKLSRLVAPYDFVESLNIYKEEVVE